MGLGVGILPQATVQHELNEGALVARPFTEGTYTRPIGLLVRKGKYLDRASQAVLDAFKAAASEHIQ
jgi:DNA-binding transcriptional LysR family regulator